VITLFPPKQIGAKFHSSSRQNNAPNLMFHCEFNVPLLFPPKQCAEFNVPSPSEEDEDRKNQ
jgi:hypothetical protein